MVEPTEPVTYTAFDAEDRPVAGHTASGVEFTITYSPDGSSLQQFEDGSSVSFDPDGVVVSRTTADGTTYTAFDDQGRPVEGHTADGDDFTITYSSDGSSLQRFEDGSTVQRFADGSSVSFDPDGVVVSRTTSDGTTYTAFDDQGRPVEGHTAGGDGFTIAYGADGSWVQRFGDGSSVSFDRHGGVVSQTTSDGTTYTAFDDRGRPVEGHTAGGEGFTITHSLDGSSVHQFDDGSSVSFDRHGGAVSQTTPIPASAPASPTPSAPTTAAVTGGTRSVATHGGNGAFEADLAALNGAIGGVSSQRDTIDAHIAQLRLTFTGIEAAWRSPSGASFSSLVTSFNAASDDLMALLDEAIGRMRATYATYSTTEGTNVRNLT